MITAVTAGCMFGPYMPMVAADAAEMSVGVQKTAVEKANDYIGQQSLRQANLRWYPKYHVAAPVGWINDPNGLCYYEGRYHVFFQYHPYSAQWGPMHWGHVSSADMVHWQDEPVAIAPGESYDRNGCFSGSAIEKDGKLYLMYTGHVDLNPAEKKQQHVDRVETQCLAVSDDGKYFAKFTGNPVITIPKRPDVYGVDFRDPMVWQHEGKYYAVVGSKAAPELGQVLLFRSDDLQKWDMVSIMAKGHGNEGKMWECPNFATVDGHDVLIVSPQFVQPEGDKYRNVHQSVYMLGHLNYKTGEFDRGEFQMLDRGFDFYAPQVYKAADGRTMMIGWLDMWDCKLPEQQDGWAGMMTVPRELHYKEGRLVTPPARELMSLRKNEKLRADLTIDREQTLGTLTDGVGEFEMELDLTKAGGTTIQLVTGDAERTELSYDRKSGIFRMDRNYSGRNAEGVRRAPVNAPGGKLKVRGYVDGSSLEVFLNDGETVFSSRIYPSSDKMAVKVAGKCGQVKVDRAAFYDLK